MLSSSPQNIGFKNSNEQPTKIGEGEGRGQQNEEKLREDQTADSAPSYNPRTKERISKFDAKSVFCSW